MTQVSSRYYHILLNTCVTLKHTYYSPLTKSRVNQNQMLDLYNVPKQPTYIGYQRMYFSPSVQVNFQRSI